MSDALNFEMMELDSGDVILREVGSEEGHMVKIGFDREVSKMLGKGKIDVCRAMMTAGIEAAQGVRDGALKNPMLLDMDKDSLIQHFSKQYPQDLYESRVLH